MKFFLTVNLIFTRVRKNVNCNKSKGDFWKVMNQSFQRLYCSYSSDFSIVNQNQSSLLWPQSVWWKNINTESRKTLHFQLGLLASCLPNKPLWKQSRRWTNVVEWTREIHTKLDPLSSTLEYGPLCLFFLAFLA